MNRQSDFASSSQGGFSPRGFRRLVLGVVWSARALRPADNAPWGPAASCNRAGKERHSTNGRSRAGVPPLRCYFSTFAGCAGLCYNEPPMLDLGGQRPASLETGCSSDHYLSHRSSWYASLSPEVRARPEGTSSHTCSSKATRLSTLTRLRSPRVRRTSALGRACEEGRLTDTLADAESVPADCPEVFTIKTVGFERLYSCNRREAYHRTCHRI